jgi:hypothetical protein
MKKEIRAAVKRVIGRDPYAYLNSDKRELIDFGCERLGMRSFADLGAVWNVAGGYSFYAIERHDIRRAILVDMNVGPQVFHKQKSYPALEIIQDNFGDASMPERIGKVDGVFFFDTLLHQVGPNWDEILEMYAGVAEYFLIFNQQYTNFSKTVRLLDLGRDEYFRNIPHHPDEEPYKTYFLDLDTIHPQEGKAYRDMHSIWQWGIIDSELVSRMEDLGFRMQFYKNCGRFGELPNVENHAFVFSRNRAR